MLDEMLGINMFWTEKWILLIYFFQDLGLLWTMPALRLPYWFYHRTRHVRWIIFDIHALYDKQCSEKPELGGEADQSKCIVGYLPALASTDLLNQLFNTVVPLFTLAMWYYIAKFPITKGTRRNLERMLWLPVHLMWVPFLVNFSKYSFCQAGPEVTTMVCTPGLQSGILLMLGLPFLLGFPYIVNKRINGGIIFAQPMRHENYLRNRELEYVMRISTVYRDKRMYMHSSYRRHSSQRALLLMGRSFLLVLLLTISIMYRPEIIIDQGGSPFMNQVEWDTVFAILYLLIFAVPMLHALTHRVYRISSTRIVLHILGWCNVFVALVGVFLAAGTVSPFLRADFLQEVLTGYLGFSVILVLLLSLYWYFTDHDPLACCKRSEYELLEAERDWIETSTVPHPDGERAVRRNKQLEQAMQIGEAAGEEGGEVAHVEDDDSEGSSMIYQRHSDDEEYFQEMEALHYDGSWIDKGQEPVDDTTRMFHRPFFEMFPSNDKFANQWPVGPALVEEILRENAFNHYIDAVRNARRMLECCARLADTPELLSPRAIQRHIRSINKCLRTCKERRVTHHAHAIHPLQRTLEDVLDDLIYENENILSTSMMKGPFARRLPRVCGYLHYRMNLRAQHLVLFSPQSQRMLLKLMALKMFIDLIFEKKRNLWDPRIRRRREAEEARERELVTSTIKTSQMTTTSHTESDDDISDSYDSRSYSDDMTYTTASYSYTDSDGLYHKPRYASEDSWYSDSDYSSRSYSDSRGSRRRPARDSQYSEDDQGSWSRGSDHSRSEGGGDYSAGGRRDSPMLLHSASDSWDSQGV